MTFDPVTATPMLVQGSDRGLQVTATTPNVGSYVNAMPNGPAPAATASALFGVYGYYTDAAHFESFDIEAYGTIAPQYYFKTRIGAAGGAHRRLTFQIGGNNLLQIDPANAALVTTGPDGGGSPTDSYVAGGAGAGDIVLGKNTDSLWAVKRDRSTAYRLIGSDRSDRVVIDKDQKGVVHGSGHLLYDNGGVPQVLSHAGSYTPGAVTIDVAGGVSYVEVTNNRRVTLTELTGGAPGQVVTLVFKDRNTVLNRANALLARGMNFRSTANAVLVLVKQANGRWTEISRSTANS